MNGLESNGYFEAIIQRLQSPELLSGLGARAVSLVQENIRDGAWEQNSALTRELKGSAKPLMDEGHLVASIDYRVEDGKVIAGTNRPGANVIHDGGTIRPVNTKFLAIPASRRTISFMRSYGLTARGCIEGMKNAGYTVFFRQSKGGSKGGVMYLPPGAKKDAKPEILFILATEAHMPSRPYLRLPSEKLEILSRYLLKYSARMEA